MGYYQGDWYAGARGDPGFLNIFKKIGGGLASMIPGVGGLISKGISKIPTPVKTAIKMHPVITAAGASGAVGATAIGSGMAIERRVTSMPGVGVAMHPGVGVAAAGAGMRGYHISKKSGRLVRNRRMRVTNTKALHRSIRRLNGFARVARKVLHFTSPKAPRGRPHFKTRRRKRAA